MNLYILGILFCFLLGFIFPNFALLLGALLLVSALGLIVRELIFL